MKPYEVLLFGECRSDFAVALNKYLKNYPNKKVISIAPQLIRGTTMYNVVVVQESEF